MAKTLSQFTITREGDDYVLHIETDDGETLDVNADFEQLDLISETIEEQLDADEEDALGVDGQSDGEEEPDDE